MYSPIFIAYLQLIKFWTNLYREKQYTYNFFTFLHNFSWVTKLRKKNVIPRLEQLFHFYSESWEHSGPSYGDKFYITPKELWIRKIDFHWMKRQCLYTFMCERWLSRKRDQHIKQKSKTQPASCATKHVRTF